EITAKVSQSITGTHDIYFVAKMDGTVTFDNWKAIAAEGTDEPEPPVGGTVNPYNKVEAEASAERNNAMVAPSKDKVVISDGGYVVAKNVDFSKGISGLTIYANANQPKIKLKVYIDEAGFKAKTPIGEINIGMDITKETYLKISSDITGKHDVYFEAQGTVNFDAWKALAAEGQDEPPVYEDVNPYEKVEAENSAELGSAMIAPNKQSVVITANNYIAAKNVVFSDGVSEFIVNAGSTASTRFEIRVGSADGELIGYATVNGSSREIKITASKNITGKKDIYFVVGSGGSVTFDSWKATPYQEPEQPPVQSGLDLTYTTNAWTGGYQVSFKVTNKSGNTVSTWKIKIKKSDINISQSWCVNVAQEGDYYVITPLSWNSTLTNGQTTEFGIIGNGSPSSTINYTIE
ncbi:MAG: cellulose binding domain-containing protein, partial [Butyrivibrio sp.]|nr:cellulose binding domain-containing protein [Butyrivibrio sp.]